LFVTEPFEECVLRLMDSPERDVAGIACLLANYFATPPLAQRLVREDMSDCWFLDQVLGGIVGALPVDEWLSLWAHTTSGAIRRNLIFLAGALYDARCEEILLRVLDDTETRLHAVRQLGRMGSRRACPHLLNLLREEQNSVHETILKEVTWVLGDVRYAPAIPDLAAVARWHNSLAAHEALRSLAEMRDDQSEDALLSLAREMPDRCVKALLWHGSPACVQRVLEIARTHPDGPKWLAKQHLGISMIHHWRRGESYNHVHSADLVDYFLANEHMFPGDEKKELQDFFDEVDSPAIRDAFRRWAAQTEGEAGERFWRELALRGDSSALEWYLNREIEGRRRTDPMARDDLSRFPRETLVSALKGHLKSSKDSAARATYLELLGFFGSESDVPFLQGFVDEPDGPVANAAFDATVRLTDPLRLSEDW
jgi:hypothetical protein